MTETQKTHPRVIAFNYVLKNSQGEQLDASEPNQPLPFLEGRQQIIPVLEAEILKMAEGDKKNISIKASEAYGDYRADMVMEVPKEEFAHIPQLAIGAHLRLELGQGQHIVRVSNITDTHVTLDGNHPLAGVPLEFDVEMVLVREATVDEVLHGHPHGLHGDAHHH